MNVTPRVNSRRTSPTASGKVKRPVTPPPRIAVRRDSQDPPVSPSSYETSIRSSPNNRPGFICPTPLRTAPTPASQDEFENRITFAANVEVFNSSADDEGPDKDGDGDGDGDADFNSSMLSNIGRGRKVSRNRCVCDVC